MKTYKNYIGGRWVNTSSHKTLKRQNPANTKLTVGRFQFSNKKDVDKAVKAAKKALPMWKKVPAPKRAAILYEVCRLLEKEKKRLAILETKEMGKVLKEAEGDVQEAIDIGYYMAGEGRRLHGQTTPSELQNKNIRTVREPVGVFGLITPWNFPIAIPAWKIFPALVCGNTVVFKPSQYSTCSAVEFVKLFEKAGLPAGVLNMVTGTGKETGTHVVQHDEIDAISFTGSTGVGKFVGEHCGKNLKKHSLEMGGKNVVIIDEYANIDLAVDGCIWAAFGTTGQRCTACSRIIVHKKVYKTFRKKFLAKAKKLKIGYGLKKGVDIGPVVNADQIEKIEKYIEIAEKQDKVKKLCGGKRLHKGVHANGYFFQPTIFDNVKPHHRIAQEEIFGPVVALIQANNFKDAIKFANNVVYGLSSAIFTQNINNANIAARDLETGLVYINTSTIGAEVQTPFGGMKNTGNGHREAGGLGGALETYTNMKVVSTDYSGSIQKAQGIE